MQLVNHAVREEMSTDYANTSNPTEAYCYHVLHVRESRVLQGFSGQRLPKGLIAELAGIVSYTGALLPSVPRRGKLLLVEPHQSLPQELRH